MCRSERIALLLKNQCIYYPELQIQDLLKALYQSVFGCGHLVEDPLATADYIQEESISAKPVKERTIEPLGVTFCRLHLSYLADRGLKAETLARLFALSAENAVGGEKELEEEIEVILSMAEKGEIPSQYGEVKDEIEKWRKKGFPACRHSEQFRVAYAPAYRVIRRDYAWALPIFAAIDRGREKTGHLLVAIEGGAAAGKSTLAELLEQVYDCNIFHMDDFFLRPQQRTFQRFAEPGGNVDYERFYEEVLVPLSRGERVRYSRYDCGIREVLHPVEIVPKALNIVEGTYSLHPLMTDFYDLKVLLKISPEEQKERILKRNNPELQERFFRHWIPMEKHYFEACGVEKNCDIVLEVEA